jgi:hypothetical protein
VTKADDSSLDPDDRRAVEGSARRLLDRASAWDRFPTPVPDILAAANLEVASSGAFDPVRLIAYLRGKTVEVATRIKSAISKVLGIYDGAENLIHIDASVATSKQKFLMLHETGHHELPTHRKMFRLFEDCLGTLAPEISDQFEREANNFARFALFQGDAYACMAADCAMEIRTPMKLAQKFGASIYASAREFARTHHRACVVYVLEPLEYLDGDGVRAAVRRIEASPSFIAQFGKPNDKDITPDHILGSVLPVGPRMTRPTSLSLKDKGGVRHECVAEAFDTKHNIIVLLFPARALTASTIVLSGTA